MGKREGGNAGELGERRIGRFLEKRDENVIIGYWENRGINRCSTGNGIINCESEP